MRRLAVILAVILVVIVVLAGCAGGDDDADGDAAAFCDRLDRLTDNDPFLAFGDTATPDEIEQAYAALVERTEELLDVAPEEARAAARTYAESAAALDALMADAGYDGTAVDARAYRNEELAYADASNLLLRYLDTQC